MTLEHCGAGHLRIELSAGQSTATSVRAHSPLKILVPRSRGRSVWACLSSLGGGLVAGDETSVTITLGDGTRCCVTTQASTKIYRNPLARPCSQRLRAEVGSGACLVVMPDPVQAFRGSQYRQDQEFSLASDGGLVLVDWLCSGRAARGERWAFSRFQSRNEIFLGSTPVVLDSLLLDPAQGLLEETYRLGRFNCLALVLVIGKPLETASQRLLEEFAAYPLERQAAVVCSASPIRHGALFRFAGQEVQEVAARIQHHLAFTAELLGDCPWSRKF
jgi:urease accessory protein